MLVRRRSTQFRPTLDALPARIAPTVYTTIDVVSMGSGDQMTVQSSASPLTQAMPSDTSEMVGPSY